MAKTVILRGPDDEKVYTWHNATIDSVHSYTSIHNSRGNIFTIPDTRTKINFSGPFTAIHFSSGYYIQVIK